ncbi:MAG: DUF2149 domain-containing protein [Caldimonas sp.]|uniref:DUF2149 domain-containing protein n=1 Tax=Caldimonas sp. TaxID=2838790 RepID=UPI00391C84EA
MSLRHLKVFDEDDDDPMLSAINLVDVFLVLVVALMIAVSVARPIGAEAVDAQGGVEIVVREGDREVRLRGSGTTGEGEGVRAGVAYRMRDGSIVYVPEASATPTREPAR